MAERELHSVGRAAFNAYGWGQQEILLFGRSEVKGANRTAALQYRIAPRKIHLTG